MKKFLLILSLILTINITGFSYTINSTGKSAMIQWFQNNNYWTNTYWYFDWEGMAGSFTWGFTDYIGQSTVYSIINNTTLQKWFDNLNTAKSNGTLTQAMINEFYDAVFQSIVDGNIIAAWDFNGLTNYGSSPLTATKSNSNLTVGGLARGIGVLTSGSATNNAWGGTDMVGNNISQATNLYQDYITFTLKPNAGYILYLDTIRAYNIQRTSDGAAYGQWQYSKNGGATYTNIGSSITWGNNYSSSGNLQASIALTSIANMQNIDANTTVKFRLLLWGASSSSGNWYLNNYQNEEDFIIIGTVASNPSPFLNTDKSTVNDFIYSQSELGPSETQSFTLFGGNLTTDNIVITTPSDYEISLDSTSGFTSSITITPSTHLNK